MTPNEQLLKGLSILGYKVSDVQSELLLNYLDMLLEVNQSFNLTSITDFVEAIDLHLLDSLTLKPWLDELADNHTVLDIGSGAGLPGIPIAIMYPNLKITLLDAREKKMKACQFFIDTLGLTNITTVHARIESFEPEDGSLDMIIARAVSQSDTILKWVKHLPYTKLLLMKGQKPEVELEKITQVPIITEVFIPNRSDKRHILDFSKKR